MIHKKIVLLILALMTSIGMISCSKEAQAYVEKVRVVETKTVTRSSLPETISYLGFVEPEEIKTYSLKTSGLVKSVLVEPGDKILPGDLLLALDSYDYNIGVQASSEQVKLAQLDLSKALEVRNYYKDLYSDTLSLYKSGIVSKSKLDEIEFQYDIKVKEAEQASKVVKQAKLDSEYKSSTLSDTALYSDMEGYVVDVLSVEGELLNQGYPVVITRSEKNIVRIGMSQADVKRVTVGGHADVIASDITFNGTIKSISLMPDKLSKTYDVAIMIEEGDFLIGESCRVYIDLEEITGIWINITDVKNDGLDYVFAVENGRATRKNIELLEINGTFVRVTNIDDGAELITSGSSSLSEGYKVKVVGGVDE